MPSKPRSSPREPLAARRASRPAACRPAPRADTRPLDRPSGAPEHRGGSQSYEWNDRTGAETAESVRRLDCETNEQKSDALLQGLAGVAPRDDMECMIAAELIAAHAAAMECYRCAATAESFAQRREYLNQAVRLSRAFVVLVNALLRRRERAQKAAMSAEGARNAKSSKQPVAVRGAPVSTDANSAKQPPAGPPATARRGSARQFSAGGGSARAQAKSAKQPSRAPAPASAESAKTTPGAAARAGSAGPARAGGMRGGGYAECRIRKTTLGRGRRDRAAAAGRRGGDGGGGAVRRPRALRGIDRIRKTTLAARADLPDARAHRAALIARLMEGTSLRIAEQTHPVPAVGC